jgi:hypothetical protein
VCRRRVKVNKKQFSVRAPHRRAKCELRLLEKKHKNKQHPGGASEGNSRENFRCGYFRYSDVGVFDVKAGASEVVTTLKGEKATAASAPTEGATKEIYRLRNDASKSHQTGTAAIPAVLIFLYHI